MDGGPRGKGVGSPDICELPLERRYLWRVKTALRWAFGDFDDLSIVADKETLSREELKKVLDLLQMRPWQFCVLLSALFGSDKMEQIMIKAVEDAKKVSICTL